MKNISFRVGQMIKCLWISVNDYVLEGKLPVNFNPDSMAKGLKWISFFENYITALCIYLYVHKRGKSFFSLFLPIEA